MIPIKEIMEFLEWEGCMIFGLAITVVLVFFGLLLPVIIAALKCTI